MTERDAVRAIQAEDGTWYVGGDVSVLYEPPFARITAEAIADMENSAQPPKDWFETRDKLEAMGLPF